LITAEELQSLLRGGESERVEFSESGKDSDKLAEAVTAFANDLPNSNRPGYVLVGVRDDGTVAGNRITDELLASLGGLRSDGNIQPLPMLSIEKVSVAEGEVAVIRVEPHSMPPVRYKGRVYIRIGPRKGIASEEEERRLIEKRTSQSRTFDLQPCFGSTLQDLSVDIFQNTYLKLAVAHEVLEANHREIREQLASLRFFDLKQESPTNAGILLFGKNPLAHLPGAYIQFLRLQGTRLEDPVLAEQSLSGDLLSVLRELEAIMELHNTKRSVARSSFQEEIEILYPPAALRELWMNAILHRNYDSTAPVRIYWFDDRIEIQSPGGLYGEATRENFPRQNSYRNPVIADALKTLGFVNRFGRGVLTAQEALRKAGHREARFEFGDSFVLVTVWGKQ
jgi:ATP-dependent DNA helicase RecG